MQDGKIPEDLVKLAGHSGKEDLDGASPTAIHALTQLDHLPERFSQSFIALRITLYYSMTSEKHQREIQRNQPELLTNALMGKVA
jgi:hypothetical protein